MTISLSDNNPRISYTVNAGATQTSFTVPFEFFDLADLNVYVDGTQKTATTHYTVASGGNGSTGTISLSVTGASGNSTVVITRDIDLARTTDFPTSGSFNIAALNTELDKVTAQFADQKDDVDRSLRLQDSDAAASMELPLKDARKGTVLGFNATTGVPEAGPTIANVNSLAAITTNINTVAGISSNVTTVAGISSNVTTVAGISSNVTSVAGNASNINAVVSNASNINTVAGNISNVNAVAAKSSLITSDFVSDLNTVAVTDVINDLNTLATSDFVADLNLAATSDFVSDLNTMATSTNLNNLGTVAGAVSNVNTVAGIASNISTVAGIASNVTAVAGDATDIGNVSGSINNVNTVASSISNVNSVAGNASNINSVAGNSANINSAVSNASNINSAVSNASNINTVAGAITNVNNVAGSIANVNTVATNLSGVNSFAERYRVGSSDPTTSLDEGDLFYNTTSNAYKFYNGSSWNTVNVSGIGSLADDNTPQLGGNLDTNGNDINFGANDKAIFGSGLQVYHDGSASIVYDNGTGPLNLQTNNSNINIKGGGSASDTMAIFKSTEGVELYYNNVKKFETTATGADITGVLTASGDVIRNDTTTGTSKFALQYAGSDAAVFKRNNSTGVATISNGYAGAPVDAINISLTGNVGIGNTAPDTALDVASSGVPIEIRSTNNNTYKIQLAGSGGYDGYWGTTSSAPFIVANSSVVEMMRIDSSGNVGIGTSVTGDAELVVYGPDAATIYKNVNTGTGTGDGFFVGLAKSNGTDAYVYQRENTNMIFGTNNTERMRIASSGNVNLTGLSNGTLNFAGGNTANGSKIQAFNNAGNGNGYLAIEGFDTEYMRIDSSGNVLINKTSSSQSVAGIVLKNPDTAYSHFATSQNTEIYHIGFVNGNGLVGRIATTGSGTAFVTSSDRRLKSNIQDALSASAKIDAIQVRQFDWNVDDSHQEYGLIAQELQPIEPLAVSGNADSDEMMGVDYSKLVPMLIKEIQELRGRVAALEAN